MSEIWLWQWTCVMTFISASYWDSFNHTRELVRKKKKKKIAAHLILMFWFTGTSNELHNFDCELDQEIQLMACQILHLQYVKHHHVTHVNRMTQCNCALAQLVAADAESACKGYNLQYFSVTSDNQMIQIGGMRSQSGELAEVQFLMTDF